jgi:antitoxin (DNA-binding transcriptional repressor) of toxin-antitoxin stability system
MKPRITKPNIVGLKELRLNIEKYIDLIQKGHSFIVVRKSTPIFKLEPMDEWGDEGTWETIADFTSLQPERGIPLDELIGKLKSAQ